MASFDIQKKEVPVMWCGVVIENAFISIKRMTNVERLKLLEDRRKAELAGEDTTKLLYDIPFEEIALEMYGEPITINGKKATLKDVGALEQFWDTFTACYSSYISDTNGVEKNSSELSLQEGKE